MTAPRLSRLCRLLLLALGLALAPVHAAPAVGARWVVTRDGQYAVNLTDKLAWTRCAHGMMWSQSTCIGRHELLTYGRALSLVAARTKTDGVNWRLPSVTELQRLAGKAGPPGGVNRDIFMALPSGWYWAGTANVSTAAVNVYDYANVMQGRTSADSDELNTLSGWAVNLETGEARNDLSRRTRLAVLLVSPQ